MTICTHDEAVHTIARLIAEAANEKTLVLLSGGSSASVGVEALASLTPPQQQNITVLLADERYVAYGSADSNATLLKQYGTAHVVQSFIEVLSPQELSRDETAKIFAQNLVQAQNANHTIIAVFGVGADNHIAGILPHSIAARESSELVSDYQSEAFERITIAPPFFESIDLAFVYAAGADKEAAVTAIYQDYDALSQPAQLLKKTKKWHVLFNKENV